MLLVGGAGSMPVVISQAGIQCLAWLGSLLEWLAVVAAAVKAGHTVAWTSLMQLPRRGSQSCCCQTCPFLWSRVLLQQIKLQG